MSDDLTEALKKTINGLTIDLNPVNGFPCYESFVKRSSPNFRFIMIKRILASSNHQPEFASRVDGLGNLVTQYVDRHDFTVEVLGGDNAFEIANIVRNRLLLTSTRKALGELGYAIYKSENVTNTTVALDSSYDFKAKFTIGINVRTVENDNVGALEQVCNQYTIRDSTGAIIEENTVIVGDAP